LNSLDLAGQLPRDMAMWKRSVPFDSYAIWSFSMGVQHKRNSTFSGAMGES